MWTATEDCKCLCVVEPVGFSLTEGQPDAAGTLSASLMLHLRAWRSYQLPICGGCPFPPGLKRNLSHRSWRPKNWSAC